jgi:hypothetical protein
MRILRNEILRRDTYICKITTPAAGDYYFSADLGVVFDNQNTPPSLSGGNSAKQSGRTAADDDGVVFH